jgi:DNA polymerase III delta prime subunit
MSAAPSDPEALLRRSLDHDRVHSAYLMAGPGPAPREAALRFVRALVCTGSALRPCEACRECRRSAPGEVIRLDGSGKRGPLLRHVGDHPDLFWIERGEGDTRVRIGQVRALQNAFRLRSSEGGRRAGVIADAEWLNQESQNALLRLLEEPPPRTTLVLVAATSAGLLATVRSRCQKLWFRPDPGDPFADPKCRELVTRLDGLATATVPELLDWAEEYRGARAPAAEAAGRLLETAGAWLRARVASAVREPAPHVGPALDAHRVLSACRKALVQRNANPQMVAERALLALRDATAR